MQKHVFMNFCDILKHEGLLEDGKKVRVEEGITVFLMIIGHTTQYSIIGDKFQHSNNTIHKWFKRVMMAVCSFGTEIIRPINQDVVHERILHKYHFFKNCICAIDGTHVVACAPTSRQTPFLGRKTNVTQEDRTTFQCHKEINFTLLILATQTYLDFLPFIEVKDIICVTMLDDEDYVRRKNCSTINTAHAVTLLNVTLEF